MKSGICFKVFWYMELNGGLHLDLLRTWIWNGLEKMRLQQSNGRACSSVDHRAGRDDFARHDNLNQKKPQVSLLETKIANVNSRGGSHASIFLVTLLNEFLIRGIGATINGSKNELSRPVIMHLLPSLAFTFEIISLSGDRSCHVPTVRLPLEWHWGEVKKAAYMRKLEFSSQIQRPRNREAPRLRDMLTRCIGRSLKINWVFEKTFKKSVVGMAKVRILDRF